MNRPLRAAAIAGVCALILLIPVILLGRVLAPTTLVRTNISVFWLLEALYQLFGFAYAAFIYGFVCIGSKWESKNLVLSSYLLVFAYLTSALLGVAILYLHAGMWLGAADIPLIIARGVLSCLVGVLVIYSRPDNAQLALRVGILMMVTGVAGLSQLLGAGWDDLADIPLLITAVIMFSREMTV